jgi:hypothetical protein
MTLDEAIEHAQEVADRMQCDSGVGYVSPKCSEEHQQLVAFLKELKRHREWREFVNPIIVLEAENGEHISIFRTMHLDMFRMHRDNHKSELVTVKSIKVV